MAIEKIDFVLEDVDGESHQYEVNQLGGMKSLQLMQKLAKAMGGVKLDATDTKDESAMGMAIVGALGEPAVYEVVAELFAYKVQRDGKKLNADEDFRGNMTEMIELVVELVKINWGHIFESKGKLIALLGKFKPQT